MTPYERVTTYLDYCRYRKELDDKTLKAYRIDLRQFFEFCAVSDPDRKRIEEYITDLHKKYKQKTVKRKLASVKAFYSYLEDEEYIENNPFRKIKVRFKEAVTLPRIISRQDIEKLLNYIYSKGKSVPAERRRYWLRDAAIVETFFATGIRVYELSNIRTDSIDLSSGVLRIYGKGNKERYVRIADREVLDVLRSYYNANRKEIRQSGYFFVNSRGRRYTEQSIRLMVKKYTRECGISQRITPHMFRHSFATYLIEEGVDISCVQEILGHSSIKTTRIYVHVSSRMQAEILRTMHPRNKMKINTAA